MVKRVSIASFGDDVDIQTRRLRTMEQLRAFVAGNEAVDFQSQDYKDAYRFVRDTLDSKISLTGD